MARNLDARCRQCRREGEKLFLKGEKCFTDKCAIERRNYPPGQHGQKNTSLWTACSFARSKGRRTYGVLEGSSGELLSCAAINAHRNRCCRSSKQADSVFYRMVFGASRPSTPDVRHIGFVNSRRQHTVLPFARAM